MNPLSKNIILLTTISLFMITKLTAQLEIRLKAGLQSMDIPTGKLAIFNGEDVRAFTLAAEAAEYGFHFGLETRIRIGPYYLAPEFIFSSNNIDYTIEDIDDISVLNKVFTESYNYLDIPFNVGRKLGPLTVFLGPVGHIFLKSTSDLFDLENYEQTFMDITYGWNAGMGVEIGRFGLQVRHEGNFSYFGEHITFFGKHFQFSEKPSRVLASLVMEF